MTGLRVALMVAFVAMVTAAFAAAPASATVLCTEETAECPSGATFPAESEIETSGAAEFKTSLGTISCSTSALTMVTSEEEGEPLPAEASALNFAGCALGSTKCTVEPKGLPYSAPIEYTGGTEASLVLEEGSGGEPGALVKCGLIVKCTYSSSALEMQLEGGIESATINAAEAALTGSGIFCPSPKTASFSATYSVVQPPLVPEATRIPGTVMCQQDVPPRPCRNVYTVPQTFKAELEAEVKFPFVYGGVSKEPVCTISKLEGKTTANGSPLVGELTSLVFGECAGGLCNIEAVRLPYRVEFLDANPDTMTWSSGGNGQPAFRITGCPGAMECIYGVSSIAFNVTGGNPAKFVKPASVSLSKEVPLSEAACSATAKWEGVAGAGGEIKYKFTLPNPLFLVS